MISRPLRPASPDTSPLRGEELTCLTTGIPGRPLRPASPDTSPLRGEELTCLTTGNPRSAPPSGFAGHLPTAWGGVDLVAGHGVRPRLVRGPGLLSFGPA